MPTTKTKIKQNKKQAVAAPSGNNKWPIVPVVLLTALLVLASSLGVVYSTHKTRVATRTLEELRREENALQVMSGQYLLEKSSWAAYSRVEDIAARKLNMKVPQAENTVLVYSR